MRRDLVVFGEDWNGLPSSTQHLIKHISKSRKVVWINSIGLRKPRITVKDLTRMCMKASTGIRRLLTIDRPKNIVHNRRLSDSNIYVYNILSVPAPKYYWERYLVKKLLALQIRPLITRHSLSNVAIWTSLPTASDVIDEFPGTPYIYYCCDDFSDLLGVDHKTAEIHEQKIVEKSDLIVASSEALVQKFSPVQCQHLPHGVDLDIFSHPTSQAEDLPDNGKPTAGFYGSIADWLDLNLLQEVIFNTPDWNFVFVGQIHCDVSSLKRLNNTFFLGSRAHTELPRYSQHWQVSLLPFKDTAQIRACNPLKLKEYLAAGTPIISTKFPAAENYKDHISIVRSSLEMCKTLKIIGRNTESKNTTNLRSSVAHDSWSAKARQLELWIDAL